MLNLNNKFVYSRQYFLNYSETLSLRPFLNNFPAIFNCYQQHLATNNKNYNFKDTFFISISVLQHSYKKLRIYMRLIILQRLAQIRHNFYNSKVQIPTSSSQVGCIHSKNSPTKDDSRSIRNAGFTTSSIEHTKISPLHRKYQSNASQIKNSKITEKPKYHNSTYSTQKKNNHSYASKHLKLKKAYKDKILYGSKYLVLNSSKGDPFPFSHNNQLTKRPEHLWCIALAPLHLQGIEGIARAFGKGKATIREWREKGAPIAYDGSVYFSEYNTLFAWFLNNETRI